VQDGNLTNEELGLALERLALALSATGLGVWERDPHHQPGDMVGLDVPAVSGASPRSSPATRRGAELRAFRRPDGLPAGLFEGAAGRARFFRAGVPHHPAERRWCAGCSGADACGAGRTGGRSRCSASPSTSPTASMPRRPTRDWLRSSRAQMIAIIGMRLDSTIVSWKPGGGAAVRLSRRGDDRAGRCAFSIPRAPRPSSKTLYARGARRRASALRGLCAGAETARRLHVSVVVTPVLGKNGVPVGASAIVRDETERKTHRAAAGRCAGSADADQQPAQDGSGGWRHGHLRGGRRTGQDHLVRRDLCAGRHRAHLGHLPMAAIERFVHPDDLGIGAHQQRRRVRGRRHLRERVPRHSCGWPGALALRARPSLGERRQARQDLRHQHGTSPTARNGKRISVSCCRRSRIARRTC